MKNTLFLLTALLIVVGRVDAQTVEVNYVKYDFDNDGKVERGEFVSEITGDFNGDGRKESLSLYTYCDDLGDNGEQLEYEECEFYNLVLSKDSNLPKLSFGLLAFELVNEGDLDGDCADEFGFFRSGHHGSWGEYRVYSLRDGKWHQVVSMSHSVSWDEETPLQQWVRKDPNRQGHVIVRKIYIEEGVIKNISIPLK